MAATTVYDLEVELLECIRLELEAMGQEIPCRICVTPGEIVWDECSNTGQLIASTVDVYYSNVFPLDVSQDPTSSTTCNPGIPTATITISLMRCAPTVSGNPPRTPSCAQLSETSINITKDSYAMRAALTCCLEGKRSTYQIVDFRLGRTIISGPEGGCIGNSITFYVGFSDA